MLQATCSLLHPRHQRPCSNYTEAARRPLNLTTDFNKPVNSESARRASIRPPVNCGNQISRIVIPGASLLCQSLSLRRDVHISVCNSNASLTPPCRKAAILSFYLLYTGIPACLYPFNYWSRRRIPKGKVAAIASRRMAAAPIPVCLCAC